MNDNDKKKPEVGRPENWRGERFGSPLPRRPPIKKPFGFPRQIKPEPEYIKK